MTEIASMPPSMVNHPDVLWYIIIGLLFLLSGILHGVGVFLMRLGSKTLDRMEKKMNDFMEEQKLIRLELAKEYLSKKEFDNWQAGRDEIWVAVNNHRHAPDGGVIRSSGGKK